MPIDRLPAGARQRVTGHYVRVNHTIDMVHFVLSDSGVPAAQLQLLGFARIIDPAQDDPLVAGHISREARHTGARFRENRFRVVHNPYLRVDQHLLPSTYFIW